MTADGKAVWASLKQHAVHQKHAWPGAWVNTLFRNEGAGLSSELITSAVDLTVEKWGEPPRGIITFVDPGKVRRKRDPGRCYLRAGWAHLGWTKGGHGRPQLRVLGTRMVW